MGFNGKISVGTTSKHKDFGQVLLVPNAPRNLISLSKLIDDGWDVKYNSINDSFTTVKYINGKINRRLIFVRVGPIYEHVNACNETVCLTIDVVNKVKRLHKNLGHISDQHLIKLLDNKKVTGMGVSSNDVRTTRKFFGKCLICQEMKSKRPSKKTSTKPIAQEIGNKVHIDLFEYGKQNQKSYHLILVDEATGYLCVEEMKNKTENEYKRCIKKTIDLYKSRRYDIKIIATDRETGVLTCESWLNSQGIVLEKCDTGAHDSYAERYISSVKSNAITIEKSLIFNLPIAWHGYLLRNTVQNLNLRPIRHSIESPFEKFTGSSLFADRHLRCNFGDILLFTGAYLTKDKENLPKAYWGIVLERDFNSRGTKKVLLIDTGKITYLNNFINDKPPELVLQKVRSLLKNAGKHQELQINNKEFDFDKKVGSDIIIPDNLKNVISNDIPNNISNINPYNSDDAIKIQLQNDKEKAYNNQISTDKPVLTKYVSKRRRNPRRYPRIDYSKFDDIIDGKFLQVPGGDDVVKLLKQKQNPLSQHETANLTQEELDKIDPNQLNDAIDNELKQFEDQKVMEPMIPNIDDIPIPCRMIITKKNVNDELIVKCRIVAGGHKQDKGCYQLNEITSPTVNIQSILAITAITQHKGYKITTADVKGAYLFAPIKKKIFMRFNKTLSDRLIKINKIYKKSVDHLGRVTVILHKALYGLVEAANLWFNDISNFLLKEIKMKKTYSDECVFVDQGRDLIVAVYVDDLFISGPEKEKSTFIKICESKYPGLKYSTRNKFEYRGLEFDQTDSSQFTITQTKYIKELVKIANVKKISNLPAGKNLLTRKKCEELSQENKEKYQKLLAMTQWVANQTRADIKLSCSVLSTRVNNSTGDDMKKLYKVIKYLNGTSSIGIKVNNSSSLRLRAYADAAYSCHEDLKGQGGYIIFLGNVPIQVESKKQKMIAQSSTESELLALNSSLNSIMWMKYLIEDLGIKQRKIKLYQDNKSTISMVKNGRPGKGSKHINIRFFNISEKEKEGEIITKYKPTNRMLADILTKPIGGNDFIKMRDKILGYNNIINKQATY